MKTRKCRGAARAQTPVPPGEAGVIRLPAEVCGGGCFDLAPGPVPIFDATGTTWMDKVAISDLIRAARDRSIHFRFQPGPLLEKLQRYFSHHLQRDLLGELADDLSGEAWVLRL